MKAVYLIQAATFLLPSIYLCAKSIPRGAAVWWMLLAALLVGNVGWWLVYFGDPGAVTKYLWEYKVQTAAAMASVLICFFTAVYSWTYYPLRSAAAPTLLGLYLSVDVAANALYRWTEYVYDFQRLLQQGVHLGHLLVLLMALGCEIKRMEKQ